MSQSPTHHRTLIAAAIAAAILTPAAAGVAFMYLGLAATVTIAMGGGALAMALVFAAVLDGFSTALQAALYGVDEHGHPNPRPERETSR